MLPSVFYHINKATWISKNTFPVDIDLVNQYLLFPVEPTSVTVWDVDVTIGLENGEFRDLARQCWAAYDMEPGEEMLRTKCWNATHHT